MGTHPIFESDFDCLTETKKYMEVEVKEERAEYPEEEKFDPNLKHVLVFTMSGKPVWSRYGIEETNTAFVGILFTIYSILDGADDEIREIELGQGRRLVFFITPPLILVSIAFGQANQLRNELSIVRDQILSLMSGGEIKKRYLNNSSFDLRRFISGSEKFLHSICDSIESDPAFFLCGLNLVPLNSSKRDQIGSILAGCRDSPIDKSIEPGLVYSMLCYDGKVLAMCQDKYIPTFDPVDVLLLLNLIKNQKSLKDAEVWLPVCLPKLEEGHSLQAHISYIDDSTRLCLILVSRDRSPENFHALQKVRDDIIARMAKKKLFEELARSCAGLANAGLGYSVADIGIVDLEHFLYFCNGNKQMTAPVDHVPGGFELYRSLNAILSDEKVNLLYRVNQRTVCIAWKTKNFNLYALFAPLTSRKTAIQSITKLLQWLRKKEPELLSTKSYRY